MSVIQIYEHLMTYYDLEKVKSWNIKSDIHDVCSKVVHH